ncbi:MAG: hypothetical protein ABL909_00725 [Sphingopyxis sp.]
MIDEVGRAWASDFHAQPMISRLAVVLSAMSDSPPTSAVDFTSRLLPWTQSLDWVYGFVDSIATHMRTDDFAHISRGIFSTDGMIGLALSVAQNASCTLTLLDSMAFAQLHAPYVMFDDGYSMTILIDGGPVITDRFILCDDGVEAGESVTLKKHQPVTVECQNEQLLIKSVHRDAILLRFAYQKPVGGARVNAYDVATGQLLRRAVADRDVSAQLALLLLADEAEAKGSDEWLDVYDQLTDHGDSMLRWEAMRRLVHHDPVRAWPKLEAMAKGDVDPSVRTVAQGVRSLLAQKVH